MNNLISGKRDMPPEITANAGFMEIVDFVRKVGGHDGDATPERIFKIIDDPIFLPLLMFFCGSVDRDSMRKKGSAGGLKRSERYEPQRNAARLCYTKNNKNMTSCRLEAEMMIASSLSHSAIKKLIREFKAQDK